MSISREKRFTRADTITFALLTCASTLVIFSFTARWFSSGNWLTHPGGFLVLTFIVFFKIANS